MTPLAGDLPVAARRRGTPNRVLPLAPDGHHYHREHGVWFVRAPWWPRAVPLDAYVLTRLDIHDLVRRTAA